ncbi:54S ribosomal subunit [Hyphodiscus hymeniophilus]|uniref:Large ribosomal subunit protein bL28m n=1 Tax=Hyphodiscus hymeniophilus TaxID=353542 RepID=A0A9P7AUA3_9HELO|nr:54S ribosomal subunit [Hyphodiscus hymeniophilus]
MPLRAPSHPSLTCLRNFTSTSSLLAKSTKKRLAFEHANIPVYPYGPSELYKQSNFGLYGAQKIQFGNSVSEKNEIKNRRYWRPNVHSKRLWSDSLETFIRVRITTRVLRTLDKVGGLDEYLLGEKAGRIKELGMEGWKLRWRIMQTKKIKERFKTQRKQLGLPPVEGALVGSSGNLASAEEVEEEVRLFDRDLEMGKDMKLGEELEQDAEDGGFMQEGRPGSKDKVEL